MNKAFRKMFDILKADAVVLKVHCCNGHWFFYDRSRPAVVKQDAARLKKQRTFIVKNKRWFKNDDIR